MKRIQTVPRVLCNLVLLVLYKLFDVELFLCDERVDDGNHCDYAWNIRTNKYYPICPNMFNDNTINYGYNVKFNEGQIIKGKIQNKMIMLIK